MPSSTPLRIVLVLSALGACRPTSTSAMESTSRPSAVSSIADAGRAPPRLAASDGGGIEEPLGLAARAGTSDGAQHENDAGFRAHGKKAFAESRDAFTRAIALDTDFTMARYNLACAFARLGALDDAERELGRVLREDLPSYRRGLERDEDLAALRGSPERIGRLRALVARLEAGYHTAMVRGLRATLWAASKPGRWVTNADQRVLAQPSVLRIGVYDPETKRFVPVAPTSKRPPLAAVWGREAPYGVLLGGAWNPNCGGDVCQWIDGVSAEVYDDSLSGEPVVTIATKGQAGNARADWSGGVLDFEVFRAWERVDGDNGTFVHTWTPGGAAKVKRFGVEAARRVLGAPPRVEVDLVGPTGVSTTRESGGVSWDAKSRTLKLVSGPGAEVAITDVPSKIHAPQAVLSPDRRRALLVWSKTGNCDVDRPRLFVENAVLLVDFDTKTVTKLAEGKGAADAGFDARGEAYVQLDAVLSHVGHDLELEALPKGVLLSPPALHEWSCVGFW